MLSSIKKYFIEIIVAVSSLAFSYWLMFSTFSYKDGEILIASKLWSDFAAHIPLIRSFSFGSNFPPQDPLFAGPPSNYHFTFYALTGLLEKLGIRIDIALNLLSVIGFAGLMIAIYFFAKKIFNSRSVGIMSVLFLIFNGSFGFLSFFQKHPLSLNSLKDITTNTAFSSFGPYDQGVVSAFWNLNIYTNQRHLAGAYAISLITIFIFLYSSIKNSSSAGYDNLLNRNKTSAVSIRTSIILGIVLGFLFYLHIAVFFISIVMIGVLLFLFSDIRRPILITLITAAFFTVPQYLYFKSIGAEGGLGIQFMPGYLIKDNLNYANFVSYWYMNLGLHLFLIPVGLLMASNAVKKLFLAVLSIFVIGNLFQFSPEIAANHKFFNYFMVFGSMFSAFALVKAWNKSILLRPIVISFFLLLMLSGIIDLFPIYNDHKIGLADYPKNRSVEWIVDNTSPQAAFFNTAYLYDPASVAGRKIFLGWPYFPWSEGYDTSARSNEIKNILASSSKEDVCKFLKVNGLDYVELTQPSEDFPFNRQFWQDNFLEEYSNPVNSNTIYSVEKNCGA